MRSWCSGTSSAWCPVNRPASAIDRSVSFPAVRIRDRQVRQHLPAAFPVDQRLDSSRLADAPVMLLATEPSLMPADSSALASRWISEVRAWTS